MQLIAFRDVLHQFTLPVSRVVACDVALADASHLLSTAKRAPMMYAMKLSTASTVAPDR